MVYVTENDTVNARDIYEYIGLRTDFHKWISRSLHYVDAKEGKDFWTKKAESTGGRRPTEYELKRDCAIEVCLVQPNDKSKELRKHLISLGNQRESMELVTAKEAAFAVKVINALKYIEAQKEAYSLHQDSYIERNGLNQYVYADFAKYRANIVGWDKKKIDKALDEYLMNHAGFNRSMIKKKSMSEKLSAMDTPEAIRVAVIDILYSREENQRDMIHKFANLVKNMAKELDIEPLKKNETNLFRVQEDTMSVNEIKQLK